MEWEFAAKYSGNKIFEWGDDFEHLYWDDNYIVNNRNCLYSKINNICSVGFYSNPSKNKISDLIGNTWEWTQSYYTSNLDSLTNNLIINTKYNQSFDNKNVRISVRGGSIHNGINCMRVTFRGRDPLYNEVKDRHSFRVVKVTNKNYLEYVDKEFSKNFQFENSFCEGYGESIKKGDKISIMYEIKCKDIVLDARNYFTFTIGNNEIHKAIEDKIIGHNVALNINFNLSGFELFGESGYFNIINKDDNLSIFVHILDIID